MKIRQGKALLKPSEIRNRTPGKKRQKDWGECPLTFDSIKEPVRAGDGNVYERWAIKKWLAENGNRSPLTNVVITPELTPLQDTDEGTVKGSRYISPEKETIKTEINTVLNKVRDAPGINIDESRYVADDPHGSHAATRSEVAAAHNSGGDDGNGGGYDKGSDPADRNKMIAALMRDTSLTPAERNAKIQAVRTGNSFAPEAPKPKPPKPPQIAPPTQHAPAESESIDFLSTHDTSRENRREAAARGGGAAVRSSTTSPPSNALGAAAGAIKRAQAGLNASGSVRYT